MDLLLDIFFDYNLRNIVLGSAVLGMVSGSPGYFAVLQRRSRQNVEWDRVIVIRPGPLRPGRMQRIGKVRLAEPQACTAFSSAPVSDNSPSNRLTQPSIRVSVSRGSFMSSRASPKNLPSSTPCDSKKS